MSQGQLAWIKFIDTTGAHPEHPIVIPPITPPSDGTPTHPIVIPSPPLLPTHPIVIPPGSVGGDPPYPAHPIVIPPEIWRPVFPEHPIAGVPGAPGYEPPKPDEKPPGTWGGAGEPFPTPPIVIPPPPKPDMTDKAMVLVIYEGEAVWFIIDKNDGITPPRPPPEMGPKSRR